MDATELFDICKSLADESPSLDGQRRMGEVLRLTAAHATKGMGGSFGNLFSQIDTICKQRGIATPERIAIQTLRRHAHQSESLSKEAWMTDIGVLARFVSAVFKTDIPASLRGKLPSQPVYMYDKERKEKRAYVRCIVKSWNDEQFTATTDDGEITVDYGSTDDGRDFSYLRKILREGMQLNLLDCDPRPTFIIVEPDFLVDISSIAACFTPYGHHPLLYTVNRLKPRPNTQAILLGNFAGTALDYVIHRGERRVESGEWRVERGEWRVESGERSLKSEKSSLKSEELSETLRRSFKEQALRFCACEGFDAQRFKRDAANQLKNIKEAVEVLWGEFSILNSQFSARREATLRLRRTLNSQFSTLLEPSFVCERLGLQGRVDLMTEDMHLLVEQKAGKNMKIERDSHDPHGKQMESHYVQLLLYYGILRYNFGCTDQTVDTRLLYSRYPAAQGLLAVNYYRTLLREAIKLRNQIVATELLIAREGFGRIIPLLSPAIIYKEVKPDGYFTQYVLPELTTLNAQFSALNPLERAYYERMMTFVYREQLYQKLGGGQAQLHHSGGAACDLWQMSLAEKAETGNIFTNLTITAIAKSDEQGGYDLITLRGACELSNFRRGDMVCLYAYKDMPDVRKSILYKGTLDDLTATTLTVRLNDGQQSSEVFNKNTWAIEHGSSDLSTTSNIRSLQQFITAAPDRRQLLLGRRVPQADTSLRLSHRYSNVYDPILLKVKQARDYFLLVGPPGTGKTSQALRHMISEALTEEGAALLLMSYTNRAVDEICSMLEGEQHDYLRIGGEASCDPRFRERLLESEIARKTSTLDEMRQLIDETHIIVGTTSTLQARPEIFRLKHFTLAIIDEASQILEPNLIGLLSQEEIDRFVLIGDYKQLPAVVTQDEEDSVVTEDCLNEIGLKDCRQSLFERLIRWEQHEGRTAFIGILNHQGRMHPDVAQFACEHFYADEHLMPVPLPHQQETGLLYEKAAENEIDEQLRHHRVVFYDQGTKDNDEADFIAMLLSRIYRFCEADFSSEKTAGVIVTYRNQIAPIRKAIEALGIPALQTISIDTVERYQGSQRDVIIYAFGVEHRYQLDFLTANTFVEEDDEHHTAKRLIDRKLNVAMTRARRQLLMIGHSCILRHNQLLREIISQYDLSHLQSSSH